jgi:hypothetical protein
MSDTKLVAYTRFVMEGSRKNGFREVIKRHPEIERAIIGAMKKMNNDTYDTTCPLYYTTCLCLTALASPGPLPIKEPIDYTFNRKQVVGKLSEALQGLTQTLYHLIVESQDPDVRGIASRVMLTIDRLDQTLVGG